MMDNGNSHVWESPLVNKATNYHTIDYVKHREGQLFMKACGIQRCLPNYAYERCAREGYHLHAVLSGKGRYYVGEKCFEVGAGQLFLLKHNEEVFYQADADDPWHYIWVTYGGDFARDHMEKAGFTDGVYVRTSHVDITEYLNLVLEMLKRQHMRVSSEVARFGLALQYLSLAIESWEKDSSQGRRDDLTPEDYVRYAVRFIRSNYQHIRISDVADYISINHTYFTDIFKERMYMSPQEYLMQVRMSKSKELLRNTSVPIYRVANEVGYEDQLSFSKMFRKRFGISPKEYRKKSES